jgi:hypothetical protein
LVSIIVLGVTGLPVTTKRRQRIEPGIGDTIFVLDSAKHVSSKMLFCCPVTGGVFEVRK